MAASELAAKLERRNRLIEQAEAAAVAAEQRDDRDQMRDQIQDEGPSSWTSCMHVWNPYSEFKEFTRKQIQSYQKMFTKYDVSNDKLIDFQELKHMMEKLGAPQTHLALKGMIREVDEDHDNCISFREFLLIFRKAMSGELSEDSGLYELYRYVQEIDVEKEGVKGAKNFFEAKIDELTSSSKFEQEIKEEQQERTRLAEEKKQRKASFRATANFFQTKLK